jgi:hypothetical protein
MRYIFQFGPQHNHETVPTTTTVAKPIRVIVTFELFPKLWNGEYNPGILARRHSVYLHDAMGPTQ